MKMPKFRFWSNEQHFMLYEDSIEMTNLGHLIGSGKNITWGEYCKKYYYELLNDPYDYSSMQFIGTLDKKGKEIYEDDIVQFQNKKCRVIYSTYYGCYGLERKVGSWENIVKHNLQGHQGSSTKYSPYLWNWLSKKVEVIGNVYENTELVEVI